MICTGQSAGVNSSVRQILERVGNDLYWELMKIAQFIDVPPRYEFEAILTSVHALYSVAFLQRERKHTVGLVVVHVILFGSTGK